MTNQLSTHSRKSLKWVRNEKKNYDEENKFATFFSILIRFFFSLLWNGAQKQFLRFLILSWLWNILFSFHTYISLNLDVQTSRYSLNEEFVVFFSFNDYSIALFSLSHLPLMCASNSGYWCVCACVFLVSTIWTIETKIKQTISIHRHVISCAHMFYIFELRCGFLFRIYFSL